MEYSLWIWAFIVFGGFAWFAYKEYKEHKDLDK